MKINMTFRAFLGCVENGYIRENKILNLCDSLPIKHYTHPRLYKYNQNFYEN
jgi:hypothetical protein